MDQTTKDIMDRALKGRPRRPMYRVLFNLADSYANAANLSANQISTTGNADFAAPMTMCQCFSIELLLKFFLLIDHRSALDKKDLDAIGIDLRGHKFTELFDRIPAKYQSAIAESFSSLSGRHVESTEFRDILLEVGENSFVKWRYIYEHEGTLYLDKAKLDLLTHALGKCAEEQVKRVQ